MQDVLFDSESDSDIEFLDISSTKYRRKKVFRPRVDYGLNNFQERFRLSASNFEKLLSSLSSSLEYQSGRSAALSPEEQLKLTLRFLATGSFYNLVGESLGVSNATVCRSIRRCVMAINDAMFHDVIKFPSDSRVAVTFYNIGGMPSVAGCIDGTHVNIEAPWGDKEPQFVNRHGKHSINAMCVCGPNRKLYYVSARWPGSVNDARVLRNSTLFQEFESGWRPFPDAILLGDSAYPVKEWLIPPILNAQSDSEERFNVAHKSTRRLIENAFGILKERFSCLYGLRIQPEYACQIFKTCCILHNLCIDECDEGEVFDTSESGELVGDSADYVNSDHANVDIRGESRRARLIQHFAI